jgi:hypothetical protein
MERIIFFKLLVSSLALIRFGPKPPHIPMIRKGRFGEGFSMRAAARGSVRVGPRPALENLPRRKPRGLGETYGESWDLGADLLCADRSGSRKSCLAMMSFFANRSAFVGSVSACSRDFAVAGSPAANLWDSRSTLVVRALIG